MITVSFVTFNNYFYCCFSQLKLLRFKSPLKDENGTDTKANFQQTLEQTVTVSSNLFGFPQACGKSYCGLS